MSSPHVASANRVPLPANNPFQAVCHFSQETAFAAWDHFQAGREGRTITKILQHSVSVQAQLRPLVASARQLTPLLAHCFAASEVNTRLDALVKAVTALSNWNFSFGEAKDEAERLRQLDSQQVGARLRVQDMADVVSAIAPPPAAGTGESGTSEEPSGPAKQPPPKPSLSIPNPNDPRDKFCYNNMVKGKTRAWIKNRLEESWESLASEQGISDAAKRYAGRKNLPWPICRNPS